MLWHLRYISFLLKGFQEGHIMSPTLPVLHTFLTFFMSRPNFSALSSPHSVCQLSRVLAEFSKCCMSYSSHKNSTDTSLFSFVSGCGKALHEDQVSTLLQHLINYFHPITSFSSSSCCHVQSLSSQDRTPDNPYFSELV